jgi:ATP-binding cassette subfamily F protein 3
VQVIQISKAFGARDLLQDVSFRVDPGDRVAVVGRNGEGKTTLLRILAGQVEPDGGSLSLPKGATIALHDQRPPRERGLSLGEYVAQGMREAETAEAELAALEERMAGGDAGPEVLAAYEAAHARLERAGGYAWRSWIERVLRGLGIPETWLERPLDGFSGGELTRASLARSLVSRPDLLLLDEPTNHLDLEAVEWLERAIADLGAAVVLVSHDRWFLESVATSVVEIDRGRAKWWPMGYSAFRRERALAIDRQGAEAERQAAEIARLERFVTRWRAGTKSRQAASRQKQIDRLQRARVDTPRRASHLAFGFPKAEPTGRVVIEVDGLDVEVPGRRLVSDLGFTLERGWRLGIVGPNGTGKTTLMETLIGRRVPAAGRISVGHRVQAAYFSQHGEELREDRTVVETVLADSDLTSTQARTLLGGFLFSGEAADWRVERLSGGERRRLSLVALIARGGNLLVLDEPTNHLDTESCEALEAALDAYDGTVIIISHDRALLDAVCTHTLALEDGRGVLRPGGYGDLIAAREAEGVDGPAAQLAAPALTGAAGKPNRQVQEKPAAGSKRRPPQRLQREVDRIEGEIAAVEGRIAEVEALLSDPATLADRDALAEHGERHRSLQEELAWLMHRWEEASEALQTA